MIRFIHIPKNAGTSISKWLRKTQTPHIVGISLDDHNSRHWPATRFGSESMEITFATVRHPLARACSYWRWMRRLHRYRSIPFRQFVEQKIARGRASTAWTPQHWWTHDEAGTQLVSHIIRVEDLPHALWDLVGTQLKLKVLNTSEGEADHELLEPDLRDIIMQHFQRDCELFGYDDKY